MDTKYKGKLYIIGIGPGSLEYLTKRAYNILKIVDIVVGYTTYIDLIKHIIKDKEIITTSMQKEVERVEIAINKVIEGKVCAVVSSGDPGIYAMASLVFEICKEKNINIPIEVIPGVPALCAGASLLGAPVSHDFASISLSDLLTPWEVIEKRIEAASYADFVIIIYNPKSKRRYWQLEKAANIILKYRDKNTPVGIVRSAMRDDQSINITNLENLSKAFIDMQTVIFIGNSSSFNYLDFIITPRGYSNKYNL